MVTRMIDFLTILAWNVYVGNKAKEVREALRVFISAYSPEVFALSEATNLYGHLDGLGYQVVQLRPHSKRRGSQPAQADIALLIRNDIKIKKRKAMRHRSFWRGPKHGWTQDPKVYRWVLIEFKGRTWKIMGAHFPFGAAARSETVRKVVQWLRNTVPGRPTIVVLDANMRLDEFTVRVAEPGGAEAQGRGIDLAAFKNCVLHIESDLGKGISDHPAKKYEFRAKVRRWRRKKAA